MPLFPLGHVVATPAVWEDLGPAAAAELLLRHAGGDWGDVPPEDAQANKAALRYGTRLLSAYGDVWIITEGDRSATTILYRSEY